MNSLNSILVEGNLTRDPVLATTPKGTSVCNFSLASNRYYRQDEELQKEVSFFDVETWAKLAERCDEELSKGRGVRVVGRLKQDRWNDTEGNPRSRTKIVAEHVEFRRPPQQNHDDADVASDEATDGVDQDSIEDGTQEKSRSKSRAKTPEKEEAAVF